MRVGTGTETDTPSEQSRRNAATWAQGEFVSFYANSELRPAEATLLERYRPDLAGRVLELGCGAGRLTGHLAKLARELHGVDVAPAMVEYCRRSYREATFTQADISDLSAFEARSFDAVVAPFAVLDVLGDAERRRVLRDIGRILVPAGLLIASSHNLAYAPRIARPTRISGRTPQRLAASALRLPRRVRNHRRLRHLEQRAADHAVLVDEAHDFSLLHYYISRDAQARQFAEEGFLLLEALDLSGQAVSSGQSAPACPELYYAARLLAGG